MKRKRQQVRQVADGGKGGVVVLGRHASAPGSRWPPDVGGLLQQGGRVALSGVRITCLAVYSVASACSTPPTSLPAIGWAGTKPPTLLAQHAPCGVDHVALGGADVHDQHAGVTRCRMALNVASVAATGTASSTMSDAGHRQQRRFGGLVDHAHALGALGGRRRLAVADHTLDQAGALQRQRKRAAHQAASDQTQLLKHGLQTVRRARRARVTHPPGRCPAPCRTRTGSRSSFRAAATLGCRRMAFEVDIEVVLPLARSVPDAIRTGSSTRRASSAAPAGRAPRRGDWDRHDQAGAVVAGGLGRGWRLRQADHGKAGAVVRRRPGSPCASDVQAELGGRALAGDAGPVRVSAARRAPSALLETGRRSASGRWC
jgi:hypothetical protein